MAITTRQPPAHRSHSPWLMAGLAVAVVLVGTLGAVFATGMFRPGGQLAPPVVTSPSPTPSPLSSPSPSPSPIVVPTPTPPSGVALLRGKIAISSGRPSSGGWITFPGGTFTADPGSNVTLSGGQSFGLAQVLAMNKWVPVPRNWVSPDGTKYAYFLFDGYVIHVVQPGRPDLLLPPPPRQTSDLSWSILSTTNTSVYVISSLGFAPQAGLWKVPFSGPPQEVSASGYWTAMDERYVYGTMTSSVPQGAANTISRLDLSTNQSTPIFTQPGMQSTAVGVDQDGNAVILAVKPNEQVTFPAVFQIWIARSTGPVKLYETEALIPPPEVGLPAGFLLFSVVPDSMGTWISTSKGLFLYTRESGLELASTVTGTLASALRP